VTFGALADGPATLVIRGARVLDPATGTDAVGDVAIVDGRVVAAAPPEAPQLDGHGWIVTPGFCDLHAHLREPGATEAETLESGARAAARGGFTTICAMPNTEPAVDSAESVAAMSRSDLACRVRAIGAVTVGRAGERVADLTAMADAGAVAFSDDGAAVTDAVVRDAFERAAALGLPVFEHAEDPERAAGGVMRAGLTATRLGLRPWSPAAETAIAARDLALARETGARVHLTHCSTASTIEAVSRARAEGTSATCDVTPHHFAMTDAWVAGSREFAWDEPEPSAWERAAYDGACRVNPPLASRTDALACVDAIGTGAVDAIATDHAPHPAHRTLVPFDEAAPGMIGLEMALSLGLAAVLAGRLGLTSLVSALSTRPASIIGERRSLVAGEVADLVVFDPGARWLVERATLASRSANTPLLGMELPGVVRLTVAGGRVTYRS
jgi:dihydroorotase